MTRAQRLRERGERWLRWDHDSERCATCGMTRSNVRHRTPEERLTAPEGRVYFEDVPFCEFVGSGRTDADFPQHVAGYVPPSLARSFIEQADRLELKP